MHFVGIMGKIGRVGKREGHSIARRCSLSVTSLFSLSSLSSLSSLVILGRERQERRERRERQERERISFNCTAVRSVR